MDFRQPMYPGMMAGMPYGGQQFLQNRMMNMRTACRVEFPLLQLAASSARATSRVPRFIHGHHGAATGGGTRLLRHTSGHSLRMR